MDRSANFPTCRPLAQAAASVHETILRPHTARCEVRYCADERTRRRPSVAVVACLRIFGGVPPFGHSRAGCRLRTAVGVDRHRTAVRLPLVGSSIFVHQFCPAPSKAVCSGVRKRTLAASPSRAGHPADRSRP
jgi:hypothetical protein